MKTRLLMALHFHQPVGNFDTVFEDAVRLCYAPLVDAFERHPAVRAAFHLSGCLLEWLEARDRPFLDRVLALVGTGQVEPLGGGFYEPILTAIPREDALDQIARLAAWWTRRASAAPRGAWVAERVWEPGLAELLAEAGVAYTILDDQHLRFAGLLDERFSGLFVTERAGRAVAFFPSDSGLRYLIPFRTIDIVREHFLAATRAGEAPVLTYGDDAEKFGLWPGTHAWVHGEGWLEKFFALLSEADGPVAASAPGAFLDEKPVARKVYMPNASYTEMLEWALPASSVPAYTATRAAALKEAPAEAVRAFVRGSLWDMFLARYPEADRIHKHVLWTSRRARALRPADPRRAAAITHALRAECNCAYWHGLFGGIYYPHLRHGVARSVLEADLLLEEGERSVKVEALDLDGDLEEEVIARAHGTQAFFRPSDNGTLDELDFLPARFNVTNVISRWKEAYHEGSDLTHGGGGVEGVLSPHEQAVGIERADLEGRHFDTIPLRSLRDIWGTAPLDSPALARFEGVDLARGRLEGWSLAKDGFGGRGRCGGMAYEKSIAIDREGVLRARWEIDADGAPEGIWFGTLLALTLLTPADKDRAMLIAGPERGRPSRHAPGDAVVQDGAARLSFEDRVFGFALDVDLGIPGRVVTAPIETLQRSEDRYHAAYQGTLVALCFPLADLRGKGPQGRRDLTISLAFRALPVPRRKTG